MHQHFYAFSARNHFDLGIKIGRQFAAQAYQAIKTAHQHTQWPVHCQIAHAQLTYAQKHFPQYVSELRGYADGAEVSFDDLWTISIEDDAFGPHKPARAKCTTIVTNDGQLIGHSEDHVLGGEDDVCIVQKRIGSHRTLELFYYNTPGGSAIGINSAGYVHAVNTLLFTRKQLGVPKLIQARYLLDSHDPNHDLAKLTQISRTSGFSHLLASPTGQLWHAELTASSAHIANPSSPFCHTNHCLLGSRHSSREIWGTHTRLQFAKQHVANYLTPEHLKKLLLDESLGPDHSLHNERSVAKIVVNTATQTLSIWLRREAAQGWVTYKLPV